LWNTASLTDALHVSTFVYGFWLQWYGLAQFSLCT
jgi:hypothetical protein